MIASPPGVVAQALSTAAYRKAQHLAIPSSAAAPAHHTAAYGKEAPSKAARRSSAGTARRSVCSAWRIMAASPLDAANAGVAHGSV